MLNDSQNEQHSVGIAESRAHPRWQVHSLAYIELSDENAGLILNISENGIAVQAVQVLTSERFPRMRFRLPRTENLIETAGRLVWQIRSKKEAGIEFVEPGGAAAGADQGVDRHRAVAHGHESNGYSASPCVD